MYLVSNENAVIEECVEHVIYTLGSLVSQLQPIKDGHIISGASGHIALSERFFFQGASGRIARQWVKGQNALGHILQN